MTASEEQECVAPLLNWIDNKPGAFFSPVFKKKNSARQSSNNLQICVLEYPGLGHTSWEVGSGLHVELKFPGQFRVFVRDSNQDPRQPARKNA